MTTKRIAWMDAAKGFAILGVAMLHAMSPVMEGHLLMSRVYRVLYWLVNPTFFLLSGLVSGKVLTATSGERLGILKKRATQLMIPYATWAVIYFLLKEVFGRYMRYPQAPLWTVFLGNNPNGQFWFLYVFFLLSALALLLNGKTATPGCILALIVSFLAPLIPDWVRFPGIGLSYALFQMGFYFLGLRLSKVRFTCFSHGWLALICGVVGVGLIALFLLGIESWYTKLLYPLTVCYALFYGLSKLPEGWVIRSLSYLGQHSLDIYILHAPFLLMGRAVLRARLVDTPWIYAIAVTVLSTAGALLISRFILQRIKPLRLLLIGK